MHSYGDTAEICGIKADGTSSNQHTARQD